MKNDPFRERNERIRREKRKQLVGQRPDRHRWANLLRSLVTTGYAPFSDFLSS